MKQMDGLLSFDSKLMLQVLEVIEATREWDNGSIHTDFRMFVASKAKDVPVAAFMDIAIGDCAIGVYMVKKCLEMIRRLTTAIYTSHQDAQVATLATINIASAMEAATKRIMKQVATLERAPEPFKSTEEEIRKRIAEAYHEIEEDPLRPIYLMLICEDRAQGRCFEATLRGGCSLPCATMKDENLGVSIEQDLSEEMCANLFESAGRLYEIADRVFTEMARGNDPDKAKAEQPATTEDPPIIWN